MFRSLAATHLAPGRDIGVMVHGRVVKERLRYEAGVFEHDGKNARTNNPDKVFGGQTTAVRVISRAAPQHEGRDRRPVARRGLHAAATCRKGSPALRGQTVMEQTFFSSSDYIVNGPRRRLGVEMEFLPGPASIKAEWMRVDTERRGQSVEDTDLSPLIGEGWYVSGTYAITGEKKSRVQRPKKPLFQGGFGAVEVGGADREPAFQERRVRRGGLHQPARRRRSSAIATRSTTLGVNWYINRFFKIQANFIREKLDDPSQGPLPSKPSFNTTAIRFQFSM